jgi:hypothetical protein
METGQESQKNLTTFLRCDKVSENSEQKPMILTWTGADMYQRNSLPMNLIIMGQQIFHRKAVT